MSKGVVAGIIIAIVCGGLLGFAFAYFILPPNNVVQTKSASWNTDAYIADEETTSTLVPDTTMTITTQGATRLVIRFTTQYVLFMNTGHDGLTRYRINLTLNSVPINGGMIEYKTTSALTTWIEISSSFVVESVTGTLPAGTYNISLFWRSVTTSGSTYSQLIFNDAAVNYSRTILVQEILS
jgi:hypothetical protein